MKRTLLAILLMLGMASPVRADSITDVVGATTTGSGRITVTVFNDSGATRTSGDLMVWDNDDTEYDRSGYPYVTTTTTADFIHTAGVLLTDSCPDQALCEIITSGYAIANTSAATLTEDTIVSTSTTAGRLGDATAGNNVCYLGTLLEYRDVREGGACTSGVLCPVPVQVNITCVP